MSCFLPYTSTAQILNQEQIKQLKYRHIGPVGNRISSVAGVAGDPLTYYVGAATGGIWKSTDGGIAWKPIFDDKPVHAIGALAVAPSDSEIVYAGTGESFIRSNVSIGNGIWKSMDGGDTWTNIGLENTGRISRVVVHPTNPDIVYVAAVGHAYTPQKERGVFMTEDGGKTWQHTLFVDENTGASDVVLDPFNPRILFAGTWELKLKTWNRTSGGPGSGLHKSVDGGKTWTKLKSKGLPKTTIGKIALAMSPAQKGRVYAQMETGDGIPLDGKATESGELWRSDDNGKTWKMVNANRDIGGRQAYYTRCAASPDNPNEIYFIWAGFSRSIDAGKTLEKSAPGSQPNWDHHEMWIDPLDGNRMIVVGDGGLSISQDRGKNWRRTQLAVAQLYHVTTDKNIPYNVFTNRQDGPSMMGPSNTREAGIFGPSMIPTGAWRDVGGGESGFATPDPVDPDVVWSSASGMGPLGGIVTRYNVNTGQYRQVEVWPEFTVGHPAKETKYRFQWTFPLLISPHDNNTVYVTSQHVHRTTNKGQSWEVISPDLTKNEKSKQGFSGGLTGDNINVEYANVIYAFDESPVKQGVFWAGTNDGLVQVSQDGGDSWQNVTKNIPGLPKDGVVRNIDASKWDAGKAYVTIEFHQVGNFEAYVYKTSNYGKTWQKITNGIVSDHLNYTRCVREDPVKEGLLYLGTETKLYVSFDDGKKWQSLMSNLPHTPMYWLDIPEHFNDLVIGTYGRGIWILDDLTPLQQMTADIAASKAHLFSPRPAWRFQSVTSNMQFFPEPSFGQNPAYGASINYWLSEKNDSVKVHIVNSTGDTIRTLKHKGQSGLNRVMWDLKGEKNDAIVLRNKPLYADWFTVKEKGDHNPLVKNFSILAIPGTYQVHLQAGDKTNIQELVVKKDPHSEGSMEDIQEQTAILTDLQNDMNTVAKLVNEIEITRMQLYDMKATMKALKKPNQLIESVATIDTALIHIEDQLIQLRYTGTGQDEVRFPVRIAERINYLAGTIAIADFPPADPHKEVHQLLKGRLKKVQAAYEGLKEKELKTFTNMLTKEGIGVLLR